MSLFGYNSRPVPSIAYTGWNARLRDMETVEQVVMLARDFTAQWTPGELGALPEALRPTKIVDANDITEYALALVRADISRGEVGEAGILRMVTFFSAASLRVAQLLARMPQALVEEPASASRYTG